MDNRDLLILKYLSDFKNITKTANALFMSQPALTKRIKHMEKELNTQLVESSNKGITLTPTGIEAALFADDALNRFDQLTKRLAEIDNKNLSVLRLTAPNIICEYYLPSIIRKFKKIHPKARFLITMAPSSKVVSLMNNNQCDFGFLRNDFGWDDAGMLLLTTNHIVAACRQPFALKDLSHMNRVAYTTDAYYMKMLDLWWSNNFSTPPHIDVQVSSLDLCCEMVFQGLGFGLLPSVLIPKDLPIHQLVLNDKDGKPIQRHTYLIFKEKEVNSRINKDFLAFIQEHPFESFLSLHEAAKEV